jgi:hypothetical protein
VCGAFVVFTDENIKRSGSILNPKDDYYMIGKCRKTFLVIKLCKEVKINLIETQNLEWLSSFPLVIGFSVLSNDRWVDLGTFYCKTTRKPQLFKIEMSCFSSILKVDILEFQGKHEYFTLTHLKVYGTTMIEDFKGSSVVEEGGMNLYDVFSTKISKLERHTEIQEDRLHGNIEKEIYLLRKTVVKLQFLLTFLLVVFIGLITYFIIKSGR